MEKRVISTQVQEEDLKIEKSLRPQTLDDYIGQQKAKENLKIYTTILDLPDRNIDEVLKIVRLDRQGNKKTSQFAHVR